MFVKKKTQIGATNGSRRRRMDRRGITMRWEDQYLADLNRALRESPSCPPGIAFIADPPGTSGSDMGGYDLSHSEYVGLYAQIANKLHRQQR